MHFPIATIFSLAALTAQVSAHGLITKPATRQPGEATTAVCGKKMVDFYKADGTSYPEALFRANPGGLGAGYDAKACDLFFCKGYQFADNVANVLKYKPGEVVPIEVAIRIPHKGYANVSVVDTKLNKVIGTPLLTWGDGYADGAKYPNLPKDQLSFSVKIPELAGQCTEAGACVIQWYWFGQGQTYESCIDFTVPAATPAIRGRQARA